MSDTTTDTTDTIDALNKLTTQTLGITCLLSTNSEVESAVANTIWAVNDMLVEIQALQEKLIALVDKEGGNHEQA